MSMKKTPSMRPTQKQIADQLGLSAATVSLALRNNPVVAKATRQLVQKAMQENGYVPNLAAASLRTGRSNIIGVSIHNIAHSFYAELLGTIERALADAGIVMLVNHNDESLKKLEGFVSTLATYGADGLIVIPPPGTSPSVFDPLRSRGTPILYLTRQIPEDDDADRVLVNDTAAARSATERLINDGFTSIRFLGGQEGTSTATDRLSGVISAMESAGLPWDDTMWLRGRPVISEGWNIARKILQEDSAPCGLVCMNDLVGTGATNAIRMAGLVPGEDIGVIAIGGGKEMQYLCPELMHTQEDPTQLGLAAVDVLIQRITQPDSEAMRVVVEGLGIVNTTARKAEALA